MPLAILAGGTRLWPFKLGYQNFPWVSASIRYYPSMEQKSCLVDVAQRLNRDVERPDSTATTQRTSERLGEDSAS